MPDDVGRCDRENNCTYHRTPKEYFQSNGYEYAQKRAVSPTSAKNDLRSLDFVPVDYLEKSMSGYENTNFARFLFATFGPRAAKDMLLSYFVGRSKRNEGKANIFWRVDADGKVRSGKIMQYDPATGKRDKENPPTWVHTMLKKDFFFHACFFGEHLLTEHPRKTIAIVESEKTAIICSFFMPQYNWIATGGKTGVKWREYSVFRVLKGKDVILFPDFGKPDASGKTPFIKWQEIADHISGRMDCNMKVSPLLENALDPGHRDKDLDLADLLVKKDEKTGWALTNEGYPAFWDYCKQE